MSQHKSSNPVDYFRQTINAVAVAIQCRVPVLLVGEPGNAKTSIIEALFREFCVDFHTSIAALYDPPYYGGYPLPSGDAEHRHVSLIPNDWVRRLAASAARGRVGLFFDEISSAPPATRAALMRGILDGVWGDTKIEGAACVAAMNPPHLAEAGIELSAPLANRFLHIAWTPPIEWWTEQMLQDFPAPRRLPQVPDDRSVWARDAKVLLSAYSVRFPGSIQSCPDSAEARSHAWPSLRTSTWARDLYAACLSIGAGPDSDLAHILLSGCVGEGPAREFLTYAKELDLPDPEELLRDPSRLRLPERGDRAYAVLTSVAAAVLTNNTPERWCRSWEVLAQAVEQKRGAAAATSARLLADNKPAGVKSMPKALDAFVPLLEAAGMLGASASR